MITLLNMFLIMVMMGMMMKIMIMALMKIMMIKSFVFCLPVAQFSGDAKLDATSIAQVHLEAHDIKEDLPL